MSISWYCLPTLHNGWFWPDLMNGIHVHITSICVSLRCLGRLRVVRLPAGFWNISAQSLLKSVFGVWLSSNMSARLSVALTVIQWFVFLGTCWCYFIVFNLWVLSWNVFHWGFLCFYYTVSTPEYTHLSPLVSVQVNLSICLSGVFSCSFCT